MYIYTIFIPYTLCKVCVYTVYSVYIQSMCIYIQYTGCIKQSMYTVYSVYIQIMCIYSIQGVYTKYVQYIVCTKSIYTVYRVYIHVCVSSWKYAHCLWYKINGAGHGGVVFF